MDIARPSGSSSQAPTGISHSSGVCSRNQAWLTLTGSSHECVVSQDFQASNRSASAGDDRHQSSDPRTKNRVTSSIDIGRPSALTATSCMSSRWPSIDGRMPSTTV